MISEKLTKRKHPMIFKEVLDKFRKTSFTEKEKGTRFDRLMKQWLLTDPRYNTLKHVWLWDEFPGRKDFGGSDIGIDLVAKSEEGENWAICESLSSISDCYLV